jgi:hypothetical protein
MILKQSTRRNPMNQSYALTGKVIDKKTGTAQPGLRIEAWDKDLLIKDPLGSTVTDASGSFTLKLSDQYAGEITKVRKPDVFFKVFKGDSLLADTRSGVLWNVKKRIKSFEIPVAAAVVPAQTDGTLTISGTIKTDKSVAAVGVKVMAYDKNISGDKVIGQAVTDEHGHYKITGKMDGSTRKAKPDIEIRVYNVADKTEIGRSGVTYNADAHISIEAVVSSDKIKRPTEYERLRSALENCSGGKKLQDLKEDDAKADITYVANKSGWDARLAAMAVQAETLSSKAEIPPAHYYALFRTGLLMDQSAMHRLSTDYIAGAITRAIADKIIPAGGDARDSAKKLATMNATALMKNPEGGAMSSLGSMLDLRLDAKQKKIFMDCYQKFGGKGARFWSGLKAGGMKDGVISGLKLDGRLGYMTMHNANLIKRIHKSFKVTDPSDLVRSGLYKAADWKKLIGKDIPAGLTADDYALVLSGHLILSYPTLVTAQMVKNREINLGKDAPVEELYAFMNKSQADFRLGVEPVKSWTGYANLKPEVKAAAKKVERLYQLSPSNAAMSAMASQSLTSAYQIMKYTRPEFLTKYGPSFSSPTEADLTYTKAHEVYSSTINTAMSYMTSRMAPNVYAITGKFEKTQGEIIAYPTLDELFGDMDYCNCEECKSVLSPAAYLVDLLQFIDLQDIPHDKSNPIDELLKRRPDIQHIQLTCENTNTVMPYLDLVNEVLEHYIVNGNLTTFTGHNADTDTNANDLLADPRYVEDGAYTVARGKVYPYNLPFDRPLEALRLLFQVWGTSLDVALDVFGSAQSGRIQRLGLNPDEFRILTDLSFHKLPEYFGETSGSNINQLNVAIASGKVFAQRCNVTYMELADLLETRFINPGIDLVPPLKRLGVSLTQIQSLYTGSMTPGAFNALLPVGLDLADYNNNVVQWLNDNRTLIMGLITLTDMAPGTGDCSFANLQLRYALPDMSANKLAEISYHKLHRFIRFWKKSSWSMDTVDKIFTTLSTVASKDLTLANVDTVFTTLLNRTAGLKKLASLKSISEKKLPVWLALWDASVAVSDRQAQLAKLLKLRIDDLTDLIEITGIDPLAVDLEADSPSLIQFIKIAEDLKAASLKVEDLNYILRHKDLAGKLTPDTATLLKGIKNVRDAINAVTADLSVAPDNADFSYAKTKMALVYDKSVVDSFFALMTDEVIFAASLLTAEDVLPAKLASVDPGLGFDPFKKELSYRGILSAAKRMALAATADGLVLADVSVITLQSDLDTYKADIKNALQALQNESDAELTGLASTYPELKSIYDTVSVIAEPSDKIKSLLGAILPDLEFQLKINAIRLALTSSLKCPREIIDVLTGKTEIIHAVGNAGKFVADDFLKLEDRLMLNTNGTFDFYLDPSATDNYIIYVSVPPSTTVSLTVDGVKVINAVIAGASGEVQNAAVAQMKAGNLVPVQLVLSGLPGGKSASLLWKTKGMAKIQIPDSRLYSGTAVGNVLKSLVRLQKGSQIQKLLKLTPRETEYFASVNTETRDILNNLYTESGISYADLHNLWNKFYLLVYFTDLKNENEQEEDTWVSILEKPDITTPQGQSLLTGINLWQDADLTSVLTHMTLSIADVSKLSVLKKVKTAMEFTGQIGYAASDVISWITDSPTPALITGIKAVIRENCDDDAWLTTMQSVSDPLRNMSRDALVTCILYYMKPSAEVDTADKLFEYFLVDVQMDACMKTSRIRLALSTVQLFIQRCLMNLEPSVSSSSIRASQWEWKKRYRVFEANRKVFLYPENWLEPELRDGKSSFYKELEGELLQADITADLAETAFLNYLKKLDDVARLEIAGMYLQENEAGNQNDDILHVFGRTNGNTRQYYYRRYEYGYWTPWEKMSINAEGDHLYPVIWKQRLFVFWLNILEKPAGAGAGDFQGMSESTWSTHNKRNIEINMCWAEYYKGKWTSPKSSDLNNPIKISGLDGFSRNIITLCARKEKPDSKTSERLIFNLYYQNANKNYTIIYTSKNCPPVIQEDVKDDALYNNIRVFNYELYLKGYEGIATYVLNADRLDLPVKAVRISIDQPMHAEDPRIAEDLLTKTSAMYNGFRLLPIRHIVENQWEAPFFYDDEHSTFFINPDEILTTALWEYEQYYDPITIIQLDPDIPVYIPPLEEVEIIPDPVGPIINPSDPVTLPWGEITQNTSNPNYKYRLSNSVKFGVDKVMFDAGGKVNVKIVNTATENIGR